MADNLVTQVDAEGNTSYPAVRREVRRPFKTRVANFFRACAACFIPQRQEPYPFNIHPDPGYNLLPRKSAHLGDRKCLVLDLDETLVHSSFKPVENADFTIPLDIDGVTHYVYVLKRPFVDEFLEEAGKLFEVVMFTASLSKYADAVADQLDVDRNIHFRLFRQHCVFMRGVYVKDLSRLGRDVTQTIIVDNAPASYLLHPHNAIGVPTWLDCPEDTVLRDLIPGLHALAESDDIYNVLDSNHILSMQPRPADNASVPLVPTQEGVATNAVTSTTSTATTTTTSTSQRQGDDVQHSSSRSSSNRSMPDASSKAHSAQDAQDAQVQQQQKQQSSSLLLESFADAEAQLQSVAQTHTAAPKATSVANSQKAAPYQQGRSPHSYNSSLQLLFDKEPSHAYDATLDRRGHAHKQAQLEGERNQLEESGVKHTGDHEGSRDALGRVQASGGNDTDDDDDDDMIGLVDADEAPGVEGNRGFALQDL